MKGANALLALLILLMTVSPCGDVTQIDICEEGTQYHFTSSSSTHEHIEDICSPFCSCACCSIPISNSAVSLNKEESLIKLDLPLLYERQSPPPLLKIWQPPKI